MNKKINGIDASPGYSIGIAYIYSEMELDLKKDRTGRAELEIEKLLEARNKSKNQLVSIMEKTVLILGKDKAEIFQGHITLLEDEDLLEEVIELIKGDSLSAEYALNVGIEGYCEMLDNLDDEYLRERGADLRDIAKRWLKNILGIEIVDLSSLPKDTIIIAKDLTPSDTAQLDLKNIVGFVTEIGGKTAHSSIMARSLEIPAIVGTGNICSQVKSGEEIAIDAVEGIVIISPTKEEKDDILSKKESFLQEKEILKKLKDVEAISKDGITVGTWANIGDPKDVPGVLRNGGLGIGLYRTEFLFMNSDKFPTEDEQFIAYKNVVEAMDGKPVTIRTMDIGGDKSLPYMDLPKEENPFIGWRALRVCLDRPEILKSQYRALLRTSMYGIVKIMLPMVISIEEVRKAKAIFEECKKELRAENIPFKDNVELGIMVETPAVAFRAKQFAKEVDFFSIGTNDLTQYTLAVDRGNENIAHLYDTYNPGVLEAIKLSIEGAHFGGIKISMCGEFAGDSEATALLFGMGLDAFSMSAISVPKIKRNIRELNKSDCVALVERVMEKSTSEEVLIEIRKFNKKYL